MSLDYIDSQDDLEKFVEESKGIDVLAIDTEFIRENNYYPNLCLVQLASDKGVFLIDPFEIESLEPLKELFLDTEIMKIFHAGKQDLQIIYNELGVLPTPIFDVQIAGAILGQSYQSGLATLLSSFLNISIKKSDSYTDWMRRPLSDSQINYAKEDVLYLPKLYKKMLKVLEKTGRSGWLDDEFKKLSDESVYKEDPYERYKHLSRGNQLSRRQMAAARAVTAWREEEAMKRDVPRKWVMSDEQIVEACRRDSTSVDDLFLIRGMKKTLSLNDARTVSRLIKLALGSDESTWPKQARSIQNEGNVDSALDLMQVMLRAKSHELGIAMQMMASNNDLTLLARGHDEESGLMTGWRKEVIGDDLKRLLSGEISVSINDNQLIFSDNAQAGKPLSAKEDR